MAAIGVVTGREYGRPALVHAVLQVEQMLTTGGGWQDQAGGLFGGVKRIACEPSLPLVVATTPLWLPAAAAAALRERMLLLYTGRHIIYIYIYIYI